jgi:predicted ArsR family transcriptional regulator
MRENSFFQTTRGRIVQSLKRHRTRTAAQLSAEQGVTPNAVRQHLARLERDGLVTGAAQRLSRTKPTLVYSLTSAGDRLFPERYTLLLNAVLDEIQRENGSGSVTRVFENIGRRSAARHAQRFAGKDLGGRVAELAAFLRERGVVVEHGESANGFVLREYNCPFRDTVAAHPEVCSVVHTLMEEVLPAKPRQLTSIARGDDRCEFEVPISASEKTAAPVNSVAQPAETCEV